MSKSKAYFPWKNYKVEYSVNCPKGHLEYYDKGNFTTKRSNKQQISSIYSNEYMKHMHMLLRTSIIIFPQEGNGEICF